MEGELAPVCGEVARGGWGRTISLRRCLSETSAMGRSGASWMQPRGGRLLPGVWSGSAGCVEMHNTKMSPGWPSSASSSSCNIWARATTCTCTTEQLRNDLSESDFSRQARFSEVLKTTVRPKRFPQQLVIYDTYYLLAHLVFAPDSRIRVRVDLGLNLPKPKPRNDCTFAFQPGVRLTSHGNNIG
eukprot:93237-Prorocentrum_minimum.AAC.4